MKILHKAAIFLLALFLAVTGSTLFLSSNAVKRTLFSQKLRNVSNYADNTLGEIGKVSVGGKESRLLAILIQIKTATSAQYVQVVDPAGRVMAHTDMTLFGTTPTDAFIREAIRADSELSATGANGEWVRLAFPVLASAAIASDNVLEFGVGKKSRVGTMDILVPMKDVALTEGELWRKLLLINMILGGISFAFTLLYFRGGVRQIARLMRGLADVEAGNYSTTIPVFSKDELGSLAHGFNRMASALASTTVSRDILSAEMEQRRGAEKALRLSEQRFRSMVDSSPLGIYYYLMTDDERLILTETNPAADAILGIEHRPLLGKTIEEAFPGLAATNIPGLYRDVARGKIPRQQLDVDYDLRGSPKTYKVMVFNAGHMSAAVMFQDITEIKAAEDEKVKLEGQLRHSQRMESIGQLAGGVAHDFNNLLMAITSYAEILASGIREGDPRRADVEEIRYAAGKGAMLTRKLLSFSRKQVINPAPLDLNELIGGFYGILSRLLGPNYEIVRELAQDLKPIKADSGQLEQILMNLVVNARDAMPEGGRVLLRSRNAVFNEESVGFHDVMPPGEYVELMVVDRGSGMDANILEHVFEPFFSTKSKDKGTGLGLSTVYGIVKQAGGYVMVDSKPGEGTSFRIYFQPSKESPCAVAASHAPVVGGKEVILLVDDEPALLRVVARMLRASGYTVIEASSGEQGLQLFAANSSAVKLVLTDLLMPGMGGLELSKRLVEQRPSLSILFMSGYAESPEFTGPGGEVRPDFLQKPVTQEALLHKVREQMDRQ